MWDEVGIIRSGDGLRAAAAELGALEAQLQATGVAGADRRFNLTWQDWLNLESQLLVSRAICAAALARDELPGCAFPHRLPDRRRARPSANTVTRLDDGRIEVATRPVDFTHVRPGELADRSRPHAPRSRPMPTLEKTRAINGPDHRGRRARDHEEGRDRDPARLSRRHQGHAGDRAERAVALRAPGHGRELGGGGGGPPRHVRRHRPAPLLRQGRQRGGDRGRLRGPGAGAAQCDGPRHPRHPAPPQPGPPADPQGQQQQCRHPAPRRSSTASSPMPTGSTSPPCTRAGSSAPTTACSFRATASRASSASSSTC